MKDFYRQKGAVTGKLYQAKEQIGYGKVTFFQGMAGVYRAVYLTRVDQGIPDRLGQVVTSGRVEAIIKLFIQSQFGDVGLSIDDSIEVCYLVFNTLQRQSYGQRFVLKKTILRVGKMSGDG